MQIWLFELETLWEDNAWIFFSFPNLKHSICIHHSIVNNRHLPIYYTFVLTPMKFTANIHRFIIPQHLSRIIRKPTICIRKNKDTDQLRSYCEADLPLCFCYRDSIIPLHLQPPVIFCGPAAWFLCRICMETILMAFS